MKLDHRVRIIIVDRAPELGQHTEEEEEVAL